MKKQHQILFGHGVNSLPLIKTDFCVLCGEDTGIPSYTPVALRPHYIEACGQLCPQCYRELYAIDSQLITTANAKC